MNGLFLITLFVDGCPIVYEMQEQSNAFHFTPIHNWNDEAEAFEFILQRQSDVWVSNIDMSRDVIDQAIEEIQQAYT